MEIEIEMKTSQVKVEQQHQANQGFFGRLRQLPIVKKTLDDVYNLYSSVRERNVLTKCTFKAAEAGTKMAFQTTDYAFEALPKSLKSKIEEKVKSVDKFACFGLDAVEKRFPIVTEEASEVLVAGTDALEKSELLEIVLTVTECVLDSVPASSMGAFEIVPVKKLERMRVIPGRTKKAVNFVVVKSGQKVFWTVVSLPLHLTELGLHGVKYCLISSLSPVRAVLSYVPVVKTLVPVQPKLRRSKRRKVTVNYKRLLSKSPCPFPASPEKKRKREETVSSGDEETSIIAFYNDKDYLSEEDPDYIPNEEEESSSDTASTSSADSGEASDMDEVDVKEEDQGAHAQSSLSQKAADESVVEVPKTVEVVENKEDQNEKQVSKEQEGGVREKIQSIERKEGKDKENEKEKSGSKDNTCARSPAENSVKNDDSTKSSSGVLTKQTSKSKIPTVTLKFSPSENKENLAKALLCSTKVASAVGPSQVKKQLELIETAKQPESNTQNAKAKNERYVA